MSPFSSSSVTVPASLPPAAGGAGRVAALGAAGLALVVWGSPPLALLAGVAFALVIGSPWATGGARITRFLLQGCVVLLGFGLDLPVVLRLGLDGSLFAAVTIGATLVLGAWLGRRFALAARTSTLISAGTAICGGSAIAAVSTVIAATQAEIAVSIGTVFLLNAVALYAFPVLGHALGLTQAEFGLWAGVAIHDISSVVGAGLSYGPEALGTATAVKLSRTLWIIPLTLGLACAWGRRQAGAGPAMPADGAVRSPRAAVTIPWFIGLFLGASLLRSLFPGVAAWSPTASAVAQRGMVLVLFLVGTSLSLQAIRAVGWRTAVTGLVLWLFISAGSLLAIRGFGLAS